MFQTIGRRTFSRIVALLTLILALSGVRIGARAAPPASLSSSVIYCIYTSILSPRGDFTGVTAELPRLKTLGVTTIWLMPITPVGYPYEGHGAFNSPYCVHDYYAVNPDYGTPAQLHALISTAHKLGLKVILDEVLNHTSWDNKLTQQHPEFYVHSDGKSSNPASIVQAFNFSDVAQLNYSNHALWTYMDQMLGYWITSYHVDGFRFDTANDPDGPKRMIPAPFWAQCGASLKHVKPDVVLLGECETPDLALKPFQLDYGWDLYNSLKSGNAATVQAAWREQMKRYPAGMLHMSIQDDWDMPRDVYTFRGTQGALGVAAFHFTINGVPLIYNGMEIGNQAGEVNPRAPIKWRDANRVFPRFYQQLIALRRQNPALRQGSLTWLGNSAPSQVLTYLRRSGNTEFLIEVNLSTMKINGNVTVPGSGRWAEVTPRNSGTAGGHVAPPNLALSSQDVAIFKRISSR